MAKKIPDSAIWVHVAAGKAHRANGPVLDALDWLKSHGVAFMSDFTDHTRQSECVARWKNKTDLYLVFNNPDDAMQFKLCWL